MLMVCGVGILLAFVLAIFGVLQGSLSSNGAAAATTTKKTK